MAAKPPIIHEPNDSKLYYHTNDEGHIWLDEKNNPIDITEPLTGHTNVIDAHILWQSKITRTGIHSSETPPYRGGAANSTAITQQPPHHTSSKSNTAIFNEK